MKEILLRVDEEARKRGLLDPLPAFDSFVGVEILRTKDLPKPLVQTFEVTITTPPDAGLALAEVGSLEQSIKAWLARERQIDVKETSTRPRPGEPFQTT